MKKSLLLKTFLMAVSVPALQLIVNAQPLTPPNQFLPSNNALNSAVTINFQWTSVNGASDYNIMVATDSLFSSIEYDDYISFTNYIVVQLNFGETYYWQVRALNATDTSVWSPIWNFTCGDTVYLGTPVNNASGLILYPDLYWFDIAGTHRYYVELDTTSLFNSPVKLVDSVVTPYYYTGSPIFFGTDYYWRVQARNYYSVTPWSSAFNFTTIDQFPLISPSDGATNQLTQLNFSWGNPGGGCNFDFQLDTSILFNSPLLFDTITAGTGILENNLFFGQTYYWRVSAATNVDTIPWTAARSFSTFGQIQLLSPVNDSLSLEPCITFSWTPYTNYILEIDTTPAFNSPIKIDTSDHYWIPVSCYDQDYYWRVIEFNDSDSITSSFFHFTTYKKPELIAPADTIAVPTFIGWNQSCSFSGNSAEYKFDEDSLFGSPISGSYNYPGPVGAPLLYGVHYFGILRLITQDDTSEWAGSVSFTTELQTGPVPVLLYPPNGAYGVPPPVLLKWQNLGPAYDYRIRIDTTTSYLNPVYFSTTDTFYYASLALNHIYYWEVEAHDSLGYFDWSYYKQFSTWNVGIIKINAAGDITVYPNPFTDELILYNTHHGNEIVIFDLSGKVILQQSCMEGGTAVDTKNLLPGFYLLNYKGEESVINIKITRF